MSLLLLIRAEEWLSLLLAVVGVYLGLHFVQENRRDREVYHEQGWNGFADMAVLEGILNGLTKAGLHALLSVLPIISLLAIPPATRYLAAIVFYACLSAAQALIIGVQVVIARNRDRMRQKLAAKSEVI